MAVTPAPTRSSAVRRGLALLLLLSGAASAGAAQQPVPSGVVREGKLSFDGRATAGDFTGTTSTVSGALAGAPVLAAVRGWVEAPVATLKTGNNRRDRDLNKSMESGKYPVLRFDLDSVSEAAGAPDSLPVTLWGRFTLHGVTRPAGVPAVLSFQPEGVRVRASTPLNLKDFEIGGLSRLLGMLRMYEDIVVHVDVSFAYTGEADTGPGTS